MDTLAGMPLAQIERQAILETLKQTNGNQTRAAKVLGISDRTLRDKVRSDTGSRIVFAAGLTITVKL